MITCKERIFYVVKQGKNYLHSGGEGYERDITYALEHGTEELAQSNAAHCSGDCVVKIIETRIIKEVKIKLW